MFSSKIVTNNQEENNGTTLKMDSANTANTAVSDENNGMTLDVDPAIVSATTVTNKRCSFYDGNPEATGASWIGAGRGMVAMSNIFIQNSLLFLATNAASCWDDGASEENESTCTKKVFGMVPSTLLTNIVTVAGLLSAFLMPICGAIVDFTPHRRLVGIFASVILTLIQGIQIYTVESTWFIMGFLQAIAVVLYQFIIVASISYLPGIARKVQQTTMNKYTSNLIVFQFGAQLTFAAIINGVTIALKTNAVRTAQISQTVNTVTCIILFGVGWIYYMTNKPAVRELPPGRNLLTEGFRQIWETAKSIQRNYKKGLRWFFLATAFSDASIGSVVTIAVIFLNKSLGLNAIELGIFFLIALVGSLPGTQVAYWVNERTNPKLSWILSDVYCFVVFLIGCLFLERIPYFWTYVWGFCAGTGMGWYYPTQNLFFSMCLPPGQDTELTGFFIYCSEILLWLPPLLFTVTIENSFEEKYGLIIVASFFLVGGFVVSFASSWDEIVEEGRTGVLLIEAPPPINNQEEEAPKDKDESEIELSFHDI